MIIKKRFSKVQTEFAFDTAKMTNIDIYNEENEINIVFDYPCNDYDYLALCVTLDTACKFVSVDGFGIKGNTQETLTVTMTPAEKKLVKQAVFGT